jgi:Do/DeqQ family serine protease
MNAGRTARGLVAVSLVLGAAPAVAQDAQKPPSAAKAVPAARPATHSAAVAEMRRLGDAFADVAERVSPSVVQIEVTVGQDASSPFRWFRTDAVQRGMGSGVVFSGDGAIVTNNHVIEEAHTINVRLRDGRIFPGRVVGRDPSTDLAVLRIDAKGLPATPFADSDTARVGEWVLAIGSPFGLGHTVTTGVLSAKGRGGVGVNAVEDYLQTDASINPGNSGGPLVNLDGQVLGINTMIVSRGQGIGLAVPSTMVRRVAAQILKTGHVDRAWIGVGIQDLTPQLAAEIAGAPATGALVNSVSPTGPAAKARLEPGDVIASLAGKPVTDAQDVIREVFVHDAGDVLPIEVVRGGKRYQSKVALESRGEKRPAPLPIERQVAPQPGLGISLRDVGETQAGGAVRPIAQITGVMPDSTADRAGLRPGDIVLEADGARSPTSAQVQAAAADGRLLLRIRRQNATFYAALRR